MNVLTDACQHLMVAEHTVWIFFKHTQGAGEGGGGGGDDGVCS